jgi:hypothetical protein
MASANVAVANVDITLHKRIGNGEDLAGREVEMTESVNFLAGDPINIDELAEYQQVELEDPDSRLSGLVSKISPMEFEARKVVREEEGEKEIAGGGPGEVTVTVTKGDTEGEVT